MGPELCVFGGRTYAIIVRREFDREGITFVSSPECPFQLAYMGHPVGKTIQPHRHNRIDRHLDTTQEVLFIRKGRLRVDFYDDRDSYLDSRVLGEGDVILLCEGAHGFEVLDTLEMYEVKQGPYSGEAEKTRFDPSPSTQRAKP